MKQETHSWYYWGQQVIKDYNGIKKIDKNIILWDETLRDGEQTPGVIFSKAHKIELAKILDNMGVGIIDIGFPSVSFDEQKIIREIRSLNLNSEIGVTIRAKKDDIDLALKCDVNSVFIFAPTSKLHIKYKFGMDYSALEKMVFKAIEYALNFNMKVYFIAEDTTRSEFDFIIPLFNKLYDMGINKIVLTDTVGVMVPSIIKRFVETIIEKCNKNIQFGIHCHNDFGLATANTLASIEAGVIYPTVTVNGIGERSGNASFEEVVLSLERLYKYDTKINLSMISELSNKVELFSGIPVAPNKAIVGYNAFRHESGVHVSALLKNFSTYESIPPELVGAKREFVLGKHSGKSLIQHIIEKQGLSCEPNFISYLLGKIKYKNISNEKYKFLPAIREYYDKCLGIKEQYFLDILNSELKNRNKEL